MLHFLLQLQVTVVIKVPGMIFSAFPEAHGPGGAMISHKIHWK